jgi:phospholipid/cholesterol/gamma-HCH transport system ATP-binding protein
MHRRLHACGAALFGKGGPVSIQPGEIFIIMGGSGCGKSTLLRHLIGLLQPAKGHVLYDGESFWATTPEARERMMRRFGVPYQSGALAWHEP